jgi:hypothetical protein
MSTDRWNRVIRFTHGRSRTQPLVAARHNCRRLGLSSAATICAARQSESIDCAATNAVPVEQDVVVLDDLGECLPVCTPEVEVIETYLAKLLQELLEPTKVLKKEKA